MFGDDLSESFAALDIIGQIRDGQNRSLKADGALCALCSLPNVPLVRGERRVTVLVAGEYASGEGGNEFEVLSAHVFYFI